MFLSISSSDHACLGMQLKQNQSGHKRLRRNAEKVSRTVPQGPHPLPKSHPQCKRMAADILGHPVPEKEIVFSHFSLTDPICSAYHACFAWHQTGNMPQPDITVSKGSKSLKGHRTSAKTSEVKDLPRKEATRVISPSRSAWTSRLCDATVGVYQHFTKLFHGPPTFRSSK